MINWLIENGGACLIQRWPLLAFMTFIHIKSNELGVKDTLRQKVYLFISQFFITLTPNLLGFGRRQYRGLTSGRFFPRSHVSARYAHNLNPQQGIHPHFDWSDIRITSHTIQYNIFFHVSQDEYNNNDLLAILPSRSLSSMEKNPCKHNNIKRRANAKSQMS